MSIFSLKRDEVRKINNEFKKTALGQSAYGIRIIIGIFFLFVLVQQLLTILNDSFDMIVTSILLCAVILYAIVELLYLIILNIYYTSNKKK